jgi:N-acetylneuraminate lyase
MQKLTGIIPALITPYAKNGDVSSGSVRKLVRVLLKKGVDGFYVCGSTGEAFMLSQEERKFVLETVIDEVAGSKPVIAHVGCIGSLQSAELAKHAKKAGATAISSITPFYYGFSFSEIKAYYQYLVDAAGLPLVVYNFPGNSGVDLSLEEIGQLVGLDGVVGIKHTSYDLFTMEQIKNISRDTIIFNGHDEVHLGALSLGSDGAIGSTFNIMPEKFIQISRLFSERKMEEALEVQREANRVISLLIKIGVMPAVKAVLELQGIECGNCRPPFRIVTEEERDMLRVVLESL